MFSGVIALKIFIATMDGETGLVLKSNGAGALEWFRIIGTGMLNLVVSGGDACTDELRRLPALKRADPEALAWMVETFRERLKRTAVHFLGRKDPEAEDVVQETFVAAFRAVDSFRGESRLYTWLNRICVRHCYRRLRQRQRLLLGTACDLASEFVLPALEQDPLHRLVARESSQRRRRLLDSALAGLKPRYRDIIERRDLRGQSYAEAAAELELPLGTFTSRLVRGREKLRKALDGLDDVQGV